jgi:chromosome segregation ATPase
MAGGERSYTMLALLLAMGEQIQSPFRCLDEYDVSGWHH